MTKIQRVTQKVFASTAQSDQITVFGTAKAATPTYSSDIAQIQNDNFNAGWDSALQDDDAPYREDRNAVDKVTTQQLAYLFETGTAEYDTGTNYCQGADCKVIQSDGTYKIYRSKVEDNKGNAVTNSTYWALVFDSTWLFGVTGNVQTQLNDKVSLTANNVLTGNSTFNGYAINAAKLVTALPSNPVAGVLYVIKENR